MRGSFKPKERAASSEPEQSFVNQIAGFHSWIGALAPKIPASLVLELAVDGSVDRRRRQYWVGYCCHIVIL
jgi:hypothetical protein